MDQYGTPYYVDNSRNYSRQQTPNTNQYVYDNLSENLRASDNMRVSSPMSQDYFPPTDTTSNLRKQLN